MSEEDKYYEKLHISISKQSLKKKIQWQQSDDPFLHSHFSTDDQKINFSYGEAAYCLDSIVSHYDQ